MKYSNKDEILAFKSNLSEVRKGGVNMGRRYAIYAVLASTICVGLIIGQTIGAPINIGLRPIPSGDVGILRAGSATEPYEIEVGVSTVFDLEVTFDATGFPPFGGLQAFNVDILWDPLIDLDAIGPGAWGSPGDIFLTPSPTDRVPGGDISKLELDALTFVASKGEEHVLATLTVHCNGLGLTELVPALRENSTAALDIRNPGGIPIDIELSDVGFTEIQIHQTPIPGSVLLLGSALAGLVMFRRKILRN
jgi:hypothetical protein